MKNNSALKTLFLYNSIFVFAGNLLGPLFAVYVQKFENSPIAISFTWSIFIAFTTIFSFIFSKIGDKIKEKEYCLMVGFLVRSIVWFIFIFADNIYLVLLLQVFLAFGEAVGSPAFDAILSQHVDKGLQISEYSTWKVISNLSMVLATVCGGIIVNYLGFPCLFLIMSMLALFVFFGILVKPRRLL